MAARGGARPGSGRKPSVIKRAAHASPIQQTEAKISGKLPWLVDQMLILAEGVQIQKTDARGRTRVWSEPPDRAAIEYLMDRVMGKPTQPVDMKLLVQEAAARIAAELGVDAAEVLAEAERIVAAK
jgi:hypothetical protein